MPLAQLVLCRSYLFSHPRAGMFSAPGCWRPRLSLYSKEGHFLGLLVLRMPGGRAGGRGGSYGGRGSGLEAGLWFPTGYSDRPPPGLP